MSIVFSFIRELESLDGNFCWHIVVDLLFLVAQALLSPVKVGLQMFRSSNDLH